jgi:hypothetical protein
MNVVYKLIFVHIISTLLYRKTTFYFIDFLKIARILTLYEIYVTYPLGVHRPPVQNRCSVSSILSHFGSIGSFYRRTKIFHFMFT